jgi:hypothetical protein
MFVPPGLAVSWHGSPLILPIIYANAIDVYANNFAG